MDPVRSATAVAVWLALGACTAKDGTLTVSLVTAPGSTLLDGVEKLRLITTAPREVVEAERSTGFDLKIDLVAAGGDGALIVEGFDASNRLIATGQSPPFSIAAIEARIAVYMAPPMSIGASPSELSPVRSHLSAVPLSYGVVLAGGLDATTVPSDAIAIYNAYDHSISAGLAMPSPRVGVTLATDRAGRVLLFGGTGLEGTPTGTLWSFDTTVAPAGSYLDLGDQGFARTDQVAVAAGDGRFIVSGSPALELAPGATASLRERMDIGTVPPNGVSVTPSDRVVTAIFAGLGVGTGFVRIRNDVIDQPPGGDQMRQNCVLVAIPDGRAVLVGGDDPDIGAFPQDLISIEAVSGTVDLMGRLIIGRANPGAAATNRYLVVAGGVDATGNLLDSVEVLDAHTLMPVTMLQLLVARRSPTVIALPNDQVLIAGGLDGNGQPISTIELFTPDPPTDPP